MRTVLGAASTLIFLSTPAIPAQGFVNYETGQVHPIAVSAAGTHLFVTNTPDNRLAIYSLASPRRPLLLWEVFVGLEPVTVRPRTADEVWVVNFLSDSISVVSVSRGVVTATIRVRDEPTDVVFTRGKAFVAVSGSDEVRVFNPVTHNLLGTIPVFGHEPRSLVVSSNGRTVWAVVHRSGNDTTILSHHLAPAQPKPTNPNLPAPPKVGLIIDSEDPVWKSKHDVDLPDYDLVEINVAAMKVRKYYPAVGTINFGAARRPYTDEVWIANIDARNTVRFTPNLRGHAWDNRVTRVKTAGYGSVTPFDLNPTIDYKVLPNNAALSSALAHPTDVVWSRRGFVMYVAAFGTDRIGIVGADGRNAGFIEVGDTPGTKVDSRRKRGPRGLAIHPFANMLYVMNRLSNSIAGINTQTRKVLWEFALPDPTPVAMKEGRGFLYDAKLSGNGTFSCSSCHISGDRDGLAWDLGDPGGEMFTVAPNIVVHPMKGPLTTQTLRGLIGTAPYHRRGDRPRLQDFNEAFDSLLGKTRLATADMDSFAGFIRAIDFPPNPNLNIDRSLPTAAAKDGSSLFTNGQFGLGRCIVCHALPTGSNHQIITAQAIQEPQAMEVTQLRNMYKKTGFRKTPIGSKAGFGVIHDGRKRDMFDFFTLPVFGSLSTDKDSKLKIQAFLEALDTGTAPAVGYQVTATPANVSSKSVLDDVALLIARAEAGDNQIVAKGFFGGRQRGMLYDVVNKRFDRDSTALSPLTWVELQTRIKAGNVRVTFTGVPPGTGKRIGIDRDGDGVLDGDDGFVIYGTGTKGCFGVPTLQVSSEPRIGNVWFSVIGRAAPRNAVGILAIGLSKASYKLLGIEVLVDIAQPSTAYFNLVSDSRGQVIIPWPVPNDPLLVGLTTYDQIVWADRCAPAGWSASRGLQVMVTN